MITPQARVYTHRWTSRQCIVWDNRCTLHRVTGFDEVRLKRRDAPLHDRRRQAILSAVARVGRISELHSLIR